MAIKVYLSPSDQTGNTYAAGNTNEAAVCRKIANAVQARLVEYGAEVKNNQTASMQNRVTESNNWKADVHVCIHTNASPEHTAGGTRVFYYSDSGTGKKIAQKVYNRLAPITPFGSDKMTAYPGLYEIKYSVAPCVYCECEFHDNAKQAQWIIDHITDIGNAIADGLADYFGMKLPEKIEKVYTVEIPHGYDKVEIILK